MNLEIITFTNVDKEDFSGMYGGKITIIKAGATIPLPRFLAQHFAKHLADKILLERRADKALFEATMKSMLGEVSMGKVEEKVEEKKEENVFEEIQKEEPQPIQEPDVKEEAKEEEPQIKFKCSICGQVCKSNAGLSVHKRKAHSKI